MALTAVEAAGPGDRARAAALARAFGVPVRDPLDRGDAGVRVTVGPAGLGLAFEDRGRGKSFVPAWGAPRPLPRAHIFRRALGAGGHVVDATAGFGGDTLRMLSLGFAVTALERAAVVFALLEDATLRARADQSVPSEWLDRLTLRHAEATLAMPAADVVYLDAMFTKPKSTAKSPKEMQLLQDLLGPSDPADESRLFDAAWGAARARVVIKRALKTRANGPRPSHVYTGQSVRYDVYVKC